MSQDIVERLRFNGRFGTETEDQARKHRYHERIEAAALIEELRATLRLLAAGSESCTNAAVTAIARKTRELTLGYAAIHFDNKERMCNPAYVSEYLRELIDAPLDVAPIINALASPPAPPPAQGEA